MSDDFERSLQEKFWYGACDHEGEFSVHAGRCSVCHPAMDRLTKFPDPELLADQMLTLSDDPSTEPPCHHSDERPAFLVIRPSDGHEMRIYESGRIEGFPDDHTVICNSIPHISDKYYSEGERRSVKERDEANARNAKMSETNIELMKIIERQARALGDMCNVVASKEARITELKEELVSRPAAFVDPGPEPLKHNPFREFPSDRRRIGG